MAEQIVLTALDDVLLSAAAVSGEADDARYAQRRSEIARLKVLGVPVIVFTRRDRLELEPVRSLLQLSAPFITESGSAIFTPIDQNPFETPLGEKDDGYFVEMLGCQYVQARAGLRVLANMIAHPLKGFGDFTVPQLQKAIGLSEAAAHAAKAREFSEPFMTPKAVDTDVLLKTAVEIGFKVILNPAQESRFSELLGGEANLQTAAQKLMTAYSDHLGSAGSLEVVGISNRSDDLASLRRACDSLARVHFTETLLTADDGEEDTSAWLSAIAPFLKTAS